MVIVEPEERVVRHYRRTSWLSSVPLLAFVVIAYVAFAAGGADFALARFIRRHALRWGVADHRSAT